MSEVINRWYKFQPALTKLIHRILEDSFTKEMREKTRIHHAALVFRIDTITNDAELSGKTHRYLTTFIGCLDPYLIIEIKYGAVHYHIEDIGHLNDLFESPVEIGMNFYLITVTIKSPSGDLLASDSYRIENNLTYYTDEKTFHETRLYTKLEESFKKVNGFLETFLVKKGKEEEK